MLHTPDISLVSDTLRFALLPDERTAIEVMQHEGHAAMQALLDNARPILQLLWQRETEGQTFDSPERKAALDKLIRKKIGLIHDPSVRRQYGEVVSVAILIVHSAISGMSPIS